MNLLVDQIKTVVPPTVKVGIGWPPETTLHNLAQNKGQLINVYDRSHATNVTRWAPFVVNQEIVQTQLVSTLSGNTIPPLGSATLTLTGTIQADDAVALVAKWVITKEVGVVVIATGTVVTLNDLAAALAAAINADAELSQVMTASSLANLVTLTSTINDHTIVLATRTANQGVQDWEVRRIQRHMQIMGWAATPDLRDQLCDPITTLFSKLSANFGLQDPNTMQWSRVIYQGDIYVDDPVLQDLYRKDMFVDVEYGETYRDFVYPVLVAECTKGLLA